MANMFDSSFDVHTGKSVDEVINQLLSHSIQIDNDLFTIPFYKSSSKYYSKIEWNTFRFGWTAFKGKGLEIKGFIINHDCTTLLQCKLTGYKSLLLFYSFFIIISMFGALYELTLKEDLSLSSVLLLSLPCIGIYNIYHIQQSMVKFRREFIDLINGK